MAADQLLKISEQVKDMSKWLIKDEADGGEDENRMSFLEALKQSMATIKASMGNRIPKLRSNVTALKPHPPEREQIWESIRIMWAGFKFLFLIIDIGLNFRIVDSDCPCLGLRELWVCLSKSGGRGRLIQIQCLVWKQLIKGKVQECIIQTHIHRASWKLYAYYLTE